MYLKNTENRYRKQHFFGGLLEWEGGERPKADQLSSHGAHVPSAKK